MMLNTSTTRTAITTAPVPESLPTLVARAAETLANARRAAEVLEASEMASFAYDMAKRQARLAKAKQAHDDLIGAVYRAQADALDIEAQAKRRLADEYDAAQERGEIAKQGKPSKQEGLPTASEAGLSYKDIHEARQIRDAERAQPGLVRQTLDAKLAAGEEPTRAAVKAAVARQKPRAATKATAKPDAPRRQKPLAPDMRSAVEALVASEPTLHREFLVTASEHLMDVDTICAVLRALLNRMHAKSVATLLIEAFSRTEFARAVADAIAELLDAQESAEGRPEASGQPPNGMSQLPADPFIAAAEIDPLAEDHVATGNKADGVSVARNAAQGKGRVAIVPELGDGGADARTH